MDVLDFVMQAHKGQKYKNEAPYWLHLNRVAFLLKFALEKYNEGGLKERDIIIKSAYLHDVLEDTHVTKEEVSSKFGQVVVDLVSELTDEKCDEAVSNEYVEKIKIASEEARLIKLADLVDNITSAIRYIKDNGLEWTKGFFFSRVDKMSEEVLKLTFLKYPRVAEFLKENLIMARYLLNKEIEAWEYNRD